MGTDGVFANSMTTCKKVVYNKNYIEAILEELNESEAFVIASKTLDANSDVVHQLTDQLKKIGKFAGKFTGIKAHTPDVDCIEAANLVKETSAKTLITIGGGSLTDAAKAIKICLTYNIQDSSGFQRFHSEGQLFTPLPSDFHSDLFVINVPTTLSAGEFSLISGVTDTQKHTKFAYLHEKLVSDVVILDPNTTIYTPEHLWLSSGIRAIDHCIETITSPMSNILANTACLKGLRLLLGSLKPSRDPTNLSARMECQLGAWLSVTGLTQDVMLMASHGIGHILGSYGVLHGHTSCIMAPHIMKFNWPHMSDSMKCDLMQAFGGNEEPYQLLFEYIRDLEMPQSLAAVNIAPDAIPDIARKSMFDAFTQSNLRPISAKDVEEILQNIIENLTAV